MIETVIAIAIVGLLIGILLPAVQLVRDAGARAGCQGRLRQIGLALHGFHAQYGRLPPGGRPWGTLAPVFSNASFSWMPTLLPYLEQDALWLQTLAAWEVDPNYIELPIHTARATVLPIFLCPSETRRHNQFGMGFSSYLGVSGSDEMRNNGLMYYMSLIRFSDISDGAAHTLLVGERPPTPSYHLALWYGGWGQTQDLRGGAVLSVTVEGPYHGSPRCPDTPSAFRPGNPADFCEAYHFYSRHRGGANFLHADGAVHFTRYSSAPLLPALATRAGNELAELP